MTAVQSASRRWAPIAILVLGASIHFAAFARWPGSPDWDVHHSVFAAENFVTAGALESINLYPDDERDLARHARLRWMTHWPPGHAVLLVPPMAAGLSAGAAVKFLAFISVVIGGLGWLFLARSFGASTFGLVMIAAAYPWISFVARIYLDYKNDHLALAMAPWIYAAMMRVEPLSPARRQAWWPVAIAGVAAGAGVVLKYSLVPFVFASGLYLLWLDGPRITVARVQRLGLAFTALVVPGALMWLLNRAWAETSYPLRSGPGLELHVVTHLKNVIVHTVAFSTGWDFVFIQLNLLGLPLFKGVIVVATFAWLCIWARHFAREGFKDGLRRLAVYLALLTVTLWTMLAVMTVISGAQYDYTSDTRFYVPIGFGWLLLCVLSLDRAWLRAPGRWLLFFSLAGPILFAAIFFVSLGCFGQPFSPMPRSQTAWTETTDERHAVRLSSFEAARARRPDLLVAPAAQFMTELGVPTLFSFRAARPDAPPYYSSKPMEIWAIVRPNEEAALLANFKHAVRVERVDTPPGFPFVFYVMTFAAERPAP